MKTGLYISSVILAAALAVAFWPVIQTPRFWVTVGLIAGIVGTFFFAVASGEKE